MRVFKNKKTAKGCKILQMLKKSPKHISYHTPGHKYSKWDITELSYSDNLSCPQGVIKEAQEDIALLTGSYASFILTDGSTSGIFSMLYAAKEHGLNNLAVFGKSHKSITNGCNILNIVKKEYPLPTLSYKYEPPMAEFNEKNEIINELIQLIISVDGVLLTSPDYYGNIPPLKLFRYLCDKYKKLLLIDGAHGGHLRFDKEKYAGSYADLWVDGVHKSMPSFTQGAIVSAHSKVFAESLKNGVDIFRTTSPSYPIMASVEYAIKYPYNPNIKKFYDHLLSKFPNRILKTDDETKICAIFGKNAFIANNQLEKKGIYSEFCDGNIIMFYLSYAQPKKQLKILEKNLNQIFSKFPLIPYKKEAIQIKDIINNIETEYSSLECSIDKICAKECGLFPPCIPLIERGEKITASKIEILKNAINTYGLSDGKIEIFKE